MEAYHRYHEHVEKVLGRVHERVREELHKTGVHSGEFARRY